VYMQIEGGKGFVGRRVERGGGKKVKKRHTKRTQRRGPGGSERWAEGTRVVAWTKHDTGRTGAKNSPQEGFICHEYEKKKRTLNHRKAEKKRKNLKKTCPIAIEHRKVHQFLKIGQKHVKRSNIKETRSGVKTEWERKG